jgi:thiol:disulfide interchange protein DsbC
MTQANKKPSGAPVYIAIFLVSIAGAIAGRYLFSTPEIVKLEAATMQSLPTSDTIKSVQGDGRRVLHLFMSADCSFCKKIEPELDAMTNATIYRHILPGHSPGGRDKALAAWCATDSLEVWKRVTRGEPVTARTCDGTGLERNYTVAKKLALTSTPAVIFPNGTVQFGMMSVANIERSLSPK